MSDASAVGVALEDALGSVRLTLGRSTTTADIMRAAEALVRSWRAGTAYRTVGDRFGVQLQRLCLWHVRCVGACTALHAGVGAIGEDKRNRRSRT